MSVNLRRTACLAALLALAALTATAARAATSPHANVWAYVHADDPTSPFTEWPAGWTNESWVFGSNSVDRTGTGAYSVTFVGAGIYGAPFGVVSVTPYGSAGELCTVSGWAAYGTPDLTATVRCFSASGAPADVEFDASFTRPLSSPAGYAYLLADDEFAVSPTHEFNSTGATNTIAHDGTGDYSVRLPGLASEGGTAKVTAFSSTARVCKVDSLASSGADELVGVLCFDAAGAPADTRFTLLYADGTSILADGASNGYIRLDDATAAASTPDAAHQWNSTGATNTVARLGTGRYAVLLPGLGSPTFGLLTSQRGSVHVTAYGSSTKRCEVSGWGSPYTSPGDPIPLNVDVDCHTTAGVAADSKFLMQFTW